MDTNYKRPGAAGDDPFPLSIRVDRGLLDQFRVVAATNHRTVSQELRHLMQLHVAAAMRRQAALGAHDEAAA